MKTQEFDTRSGVPTDPGRALGEIKDRAVMLRMAIEYLCEDPFLIKMGAQIGQNVDALRNYVEGLEKQMVGKPLEGINLKEQLDGIEHISNLLQKAEKSTNDLCVKGELGRDLGDRLRAVTGGISALKGRVDGGSVTYTKSDSVKGAMDRVSFMVGPLRIALKILALIVLICLATFSYLFFTMETEKDLQEKIQQSKSIIQSSQNDLAPLREELAQIRKDIGILAQREMDGQEKTMVMDLNLRGFQLSEKQQGIEVRINIHQKAMQENLDKLEVMKKKSLFERLVRR